MDGGAWWAAVHGVAKSRTRVSDFPFTFHFHAWEEEMATHSSTLAGKSHGQRSLVGYSPLGCKESDTTERLHSLLAESSNPSTDLHVAVRGVAKSGTQLSG